MPTVAAGGGHILNIDFFCCKFVKEATGQRAARKDKYPSESVLTMKKKKKKENKEKKLFLFKLLKLLQILLLKLWQIRRPNWRRKVQVPPLARRVARRVRIVRNSKTVH